MSIIVPVINESTAIGHLCRDLSLQSGLPAWELLVVDGGSTDDTVYRARHAIAIHRLPGTVVSALPGRAHQLNQGAAGSRGEWLLFLHADSRLYARHLLQRAIEWITRQTQASQDVCAGHFGLRFYDTGNTHGRAYFFYAAKTFLNLPETVNGDQGLLLGRDTFARLGGFDTTVSYMEDARLSEKLFEKEIMHLLPGVLFSSARRFRVEGLFQRQCLNAMMRFFDSMRREEFFQQAQGLYRRQNQSGRLRLYPFIRLAHRLLWAAGPRRACRDWVAVGGYMARHLWQVAFYVDCMRQFGRTAPEQVIPKTLAFYRRWLMRPALSASGRIGCAFFLFVVFYLALFFCRIFQR